MRLKPYQKNILSALAVMAGGFILFNVVFLLAALVINASMRVMGMPMNQAPHIISRVLYLILICLISWFVFRSRLNNVIKATYLTMPLMVILVTAGLSLYQQPKWMVAIIGAVLICALIYYFHKKKLSWLYYFSVFYVAAVAFCVMIFNIDI
ncbi:hypothetical protein SDC9_138548 [bioreactor metagenome]|uniref:Uncharacterized protein n=1 Tax=bioreactor metagenome TaxID=1076179 RepID=A0A645DQ92_9ZZZZ